MLRLYIENLLPFALESLIFFTLAFALFREKPTRHIGKAKIILPILLLANFAQLYNLPQAFLIVFLAVTDLICFYLVFRRPFVYLLVAYLLEYSFLSVCELLLLPLFGLRAASLSDFHIQCIGLCVLELVAILIYRFVQVHRLFELVTENKHMLLFVLINSYLLSPLTMVLYAKIYTEKFFARYFFVIAHVLFVLLIYGLIFVNRLRQMKKEKELAAYQTYLPIIENLIEEVREKQHDYHNHLQTIRALGYTCTTFEELQAKLIDTTENYKTLSPYYSLLKLNLHLLSGFLISKMIQAVHEDKTLEIEIKNYSIKTDCTEYELIEAIGILIDNALEATPPHSRIYASLSCDHGQFVFQIRNPGPVLTPELCKKIFSKSYTTKAAPAHGIGLYKLHQFVQAKHGELHLENNEIQNQTYLSFCLIL